MGQVAQTDGAELGSSATQECRPHLKCVEGHWTVKSELLQPFCFKELATRELSPGILPTRSGITRIYRDSEQQDRTVVLVFGDFFLFFFFR